MSLHSRNGRLLALFAGLAILSAPITAQKRTVGDGVYLAAEAKRGAAAYQATCAACHGADLAGDGQAPSLSGESFAFQWSDMTVNDLFKRIKTAMPPDRPDSLAPETYRDLVAFLLEVNKFPAGQRELDPDPQNLQQISITPAPH